MAVPLPIVAEVPEVVVDCRIPHSDSFGQRHDGVLLDRSGGVGDQHGGVGCVGFGDVDDRGDRVVSEGEPGGPRSAEDISGVSADELRARIP